MYSLTNFLSPNSVFLHNIRSKQYKRVEAVGSVNVWQGGSRRNRKWLTTSFMPGLSFFLEVDYYFCGLSIYGFPQTMFQLSIMTLLLLSTRNPAICRVNIGSWLQFSDTNCILQTFLLVKGTVFSSNTTSRWCQRLYSLTQVFVAFIQYMQLFISSSFDRKKLQEFMMLMYSLI